MGGTFPRDEAMANTDDMHLAWLSAQIQSLKWFLVGRKPRALRHLQDL
jgi:hypothetical protein